MNQKELINRITELELELEYYRSEKTAARSYLALKRFVDENNRVLMDLNLNATKISDKDDKYVERMLKFAKELKDYVSDLEAMEKKIKPETMEKVKQESSSIYEDAMRDNNEGV